VYEPTALLLAYGLSFLCALACSIVGLHAFFANSASYQNIFSTYLRVTNDDELQSLIDVDDAGNDPLPEHIAGVKVMMGT
jgi:hypothetical protein